MNKTILACVSTVVLGVSASTNAALVGGETLGIDRGQTVCLIDGTFPNCLHGLTSVVTGSFFAMDLSNNASFDEHERISISGVGGGLRLDGTAQGNGEIDFDWHFANNIGRHNTTAQGTTPSVNTDGSVDMSGWTVNWGTPGAEVNINMGAGAAATVTCTSGTFSCADGETYTLDYTTITPITQPHEGVAYQLHLEGTVSAVPVPAAVWLFGSGLVGLAGFARHRKTI